MIIPPTKSFNKFCSILRFFICEYYVVPNNGGCCRLLHKHPWRRSCPNVPFGHPPAALFSAVIGLMPSRGETSPLATYVTEYTCFFFGTHSLTTASPNTIYYYNLTLWFTTLIVFHEARHFWQKFTLWKNLKTEPPKTFSQNPLMVSLKVRNFVAIYKCSAKV